MLLTASLPGESLMFPVLGMRGGFSLDLDLEEEQTKLYLVSWSRLILNTAFKLCCSSA